MKLDEFQNLYFRKLFNDKGRQYFIYFMKHLNIDLHGYDTEISDGDWVMAEQYANMSEIERADYDKKADQWKQK